MVLRRSHLACASFVHPGTSPSNAQVRERKTRPDFLEEGHVADEFDG